MIIGNTELNHSIFSFIFDTTLAVRIFVAVDTSLDHQNHHPAEIVSIFVHSSSIFFTIV